MSIPKIIHYCWFGGGPINPESRKCIESWKKYCPDYKIIEWNEQNFEISQNRYAQQAYEAKKYAFVSDYVRLAVLYEYGGIYLDTDVELDRLGRGAAQGHGHRGQLRHRRGLRYPGQSARRFPRDPQRGADHPANRDKMRIPFS